MEETSFLILLPYFERPTLVRNALASVAKAASNYDNWSLIFIDDSSRMPVRNILDETLGKIQGYKRRVKYYNTGTSVEKKKEEGTRLGEFINFAMLANPEKVCVFLPDDDELVPKALVNLDGFFSNNKRNLSCWSKVIPFYPYVDLAKPSEEETPEIPCNNWKGYIEPSGNVSLSQVAWRANCFQDFKVMFQSPCKDKTLYSGFLKKLCVATGLCCESGVVTHYQGIHTSQFSRKKSDLWGIEEKNPWGASHESYDLKAEEALFVESVIKQAYDSQKNGDLTTSLRTIKSAIFKFPDSAELRFTYGILLATIDPQGSISSLNLAKEKASGKDIERIQGIIAKIGKERKRFSLISTGIGLYDKDLG